jgi:hypothetical protein
MPVVQEVTPFQLRWWLRHGHHYSERDLAFSGRNKTMDQLSQVMNLHLRF